MTSRYYFVNFPHLKMRSFSNPKEGCCSICKNNYLKHCSCVFEEGNDALPDQFDPKGKVLVMRGVVIKRADYYDSIVHDLINWNGQIKEDAEDIKRYRQF